MAARIFAGFPRLPLPMATQTWSLPETIPLALLVGAVMVEVTSPARRAVADRLAETEAELDDAGEA